MLIFSKLLWCVSEKIKNEINDLQDKFYVEKFDVFVLQGAKKTYLNDTVYSILHSKLKKLIVSNSELKNYFKANGNQSKFKW